MRAQTSIESLLVLAAFLALFAALTPFYLRIASASTTASLAVRGQAFCDLLASKARDARLLPGSAYSFNLSAPANATVYFDDSLQELHCDFSEGKNFSRRLGFPLAVYAAVGKSFRVSVGNGEMSLTPTNE